MKGVFLFGGGGGILPVKGEEKLVCCEFCCLL